MTYTLSLMHTKRPSRCYEANGGENFKFSGIEDLHDKSPIPSPTPEQKSRCKTQNQEAIKKGNSEANESRLDALACLANFPGDISQSSQANIGIVGTPPIERTNSPDTTTTLNPQPLVTTKNPFPNKPTNLTPSNTPKIPSGYQGPGFTLKNGN